MTSRKYLFYISQNYSFEILRPLQKVIREQGNQVYWFVAGDEVNTGNFADDELILSSLKEVKAYHPDASFVPGNVIPSFVPGIKVQVFHGLEWKKKGHFVIRDCFDLYCTHGEATTSRFESLAQKHQFFDVAETGWPKLDNLFTTPKDDYFEDTRPVILYAPTFSPALTSAPALFDEIQRLAATEEHNWLIKFHPKMDPAWIATYQKIPYSNVKVVDTDEINSLLQSADIMVSDTSSVIGEFSLLGKPAITLNNSQPGDYLIDIQSANNLSEAIKKALSPSDELLEAVANYARELHPYNDGQSSSRIIDAVENILVNGKKAPKALPLNLFRNLKQWYKLR